MKASQINIPTPSIEHVEYYLKAWNTLENYRLQEALDKLFFKLCNKNVELSDILLKVVALNDFYSTNIFFCISCCETYLVTRH